MRSKTKPKLQNISIVTLKTYLHFFIAITIGLGISTHVSWSQDIPKKENPQLVSKPVKDTVQVSITNISESTTPKKTDSIKPKKELLEDVVDYYAEDYMFLDKKRNRIALYNKAYIIYGDTRIDAGLIILDNNKNEVYASGIDSNGVYTQKPVFVQAGNTVKPDSIKFNFKTEKALVYNSYTEQNGVNVLAEISKKENDSTVFVKNVKFTTSTNIEDPEYYFYTRKAKFVPKKKIVTGLTNMYIADVPLPIGLPFAYFPLTEERASGFIIPTFGDNSNRGFFFQNGGYYFAINDYVDLAVLGDYYTNGSYGLRAESMYALRYKFNGRLSVRYENLINSQRGFPDFSQSAVYNIRWNHNQDPKSSPSSRFSASVNLGSSQYFQQSINQTNNASALVNTLSSSVSYSKTFEGNPQVNVAATATHSQNTNTQQIDLSLPNITANVSRIYPFAPKVGSKKGIIENINLQYDVTFQNRMQTTDSLFFKKQMFDNAQMGARHTIPLSTNFKVLNYLSTSMSTNFQETWVFKTIKQSYDEQTSTVVRDTVNGFDSYRTYNFSVSMGTTLYGMFQFGADKKIQAIRHVIRPSISYNINPAFDQYYDSYTIPATADPAINEEIVAYSRFEGSLFGAPNNQFSSTIGIAISNNLEAKVRNPDTTATEAKKIKILNNLNFSTGYNIAADSLHWSSVRFTGSLPVLKDLDLNFNGSLDPYALNSSNQKIDEFNINNRGSLFRLTDFNVSFNYSFSSKDFSGSETPNDDETFRNGGRKDDLFGTGTSINDQRQFNQNSERKPASKPGDWYNFSIPWNLRLAYTFSYSNGQRQNEITSQSLMFSSNIELSPRWSVGVSSGYDFKQQGVTLTQFRFQRDLESWRMSFNWTPIGARNTSWYFFIGIKSSVLSDIKWDKRREPDKRL
jgi:lipopolysaccharide assembly outer membrane protein LptD (OstA)